MSTIAATNNTVLREGPAKNVIEGFVLGIILTGLSYAIGMGFGWIDSVSALEAAAVFTSYWCTYLCVKERRLNYPIGAVTTILYSILFLQSGLFASSVLNAYLSIQLAYGWFRWNKDTKTRPVTRVELKWLPAYILSTAVFFAGAYGLNIALGGQFAWTDTSILVLTILAQFLLDNKKIETWGVWAVVNVFAIYTYFTAGLFIVGVQYIFFLGNTIYGWYCWNQSRKATVEPVQPAAQAVEV